LPLCAQWVTMAQSEGIFVPNFLNRIKKQILDDFFFFNKKDAYSVRNATLL